jgi:hypothetical protein
LNTYWKSGEIINGYACIPLPTKDQSKVLQHKEKSQPSKRDNSSYNSFRYVTVPMVSKYKWKGKESLLPTAYYTNKWRPSSSEW